MSDIHEVSKRFWARFDALKAEAAATDYGAAFMAAGFDLYPNGGNLTAWKRDCANGRYILITDSSGSDHKLEDTHAFDEGKPDAWLISLHDYDGNEYPYAECEAFAAAIAEANAQALARAFADNIAADFTAEELAECKRRNATIAYDNGSCATHDFRDANMNMHEAFIATFGHEPSFLADSDDETELLIWNRAWNIAKAEYLTAK